jgi:hypothetical protein
VAVLPEYAVDFVFAWRGGNAVQANGTCGEGDQNQRAEQAPGPPQQHGRQDQVGHRQGDGLGGAREEGGQGELDQEQARQGNGLADADLQIDQDRDREQALGGGQQQLFALAGPTGRPVAVPAATAKTSGRVPTSSVHWLTLRRPGC